MTHIQIGNIEFYDNVEPALPAGDYLLQVQQDTSGDGISGTFTNTQSMQVTGPHFALNGTDVFSVYPPSGSTADYTLNLPSIVLSRRNLPWQIDPGAGAPWLALVLLTPEEVVLPPTGKGADPGSAPSPTGSHSVALRDYLRPPSGFLGASFTDPEVAEFEAENPPGTTCTVIDVDPATFTAVAPQEAELGYLAHARQIDTGDQEILGVEADGWFSVVIGNRLAQGSASHVYYVHLVSVEGFTGYLPPATLPTGLSAVRLLSLASWTFNGLGSAGDFAELMNHLDVGMLAMPALVPDPQTPEQQAIAGALAGGYTAVDYQTRLGERTVAWYRGPALPVLMEDNSQPAYPASESALVYDAETGMFDTSYAVAWQLGRLLMLANRQIVTSLLGWLRQQHRMTHQLVHRTNLAVRHPGLGLTQDTGGLRELVEPGAAPILARRRLAARLGRDLSRESDRPLLGATTDPSGLRAHVSRLTGLISRDDLHRLVHDAEDPTTAFLAHRAAPTGEEA